MICPSCYRRNPNPDMIMYRGARNGEPEILTGPSFFASVEVFAQTYGPTAAFYLDLQNPRVVDRTTWGDTIGMLEYMPVSDKIQFDQDLVDGGYDSVLSNFGNIVVVYLLDPDLAALA